LGFAVGGLGVGGGSGCNVQYGMGFKDINKDIIEEIGDVESDDCEHEEVEVVVMTDKKVDEEEKKIRTVQSRIDTTE